jgi:hypothetical protein
MRLPTSELSYAKQSSIFKRFRDGSEPNPSRGIKFRQHRVSEIKFHTLFGCGWVDYGFFCSSPCEADFGIHGKEANETLSLVCGRKKSHTPVPIKTTPTMNSPTLKYPLGANIATAAIAMPPATISTKCDGRSFMEFRYVLLSVHSLLYQ